MSEEENTDWGTLIFVFGFMFAMSFAMINWQYGVVCHIKSIGEDKYCQDVSNHTLSHIWKVRSHEQDEINWKNSEEKRENMNNELAIKASCYDQGYDYEHTFDIFEDYNLTCNKIDYLNDHLMDNFEKKDAGYVTGSYSGILSHGSISGKSYQYINDRVVATGQLIEKIEYHVACDNSTDKWFIENDWYLGRMLKKTDTTKIDYFTEEEFVMTYVDRCIN